MPKKIVIYKAPIYRVFAENVTLVKDEIVPTIKEEMAEKEDLFYYSYGAFINMKYDCLLANKEEALFYLYGIIKKEKEKIKETLIDRKSSWEERYHYLQKLQQDSSCIYFDMEEIEPSHSIEKNEFKELKRIMKKERLE